MNLSSISINYLQKRKLSPRKVPLKPTSLDSPRKPFAQLNHINDDSKVKLQFTLDLMK